MDSSSLHRYSPDDLLKKLSETQLTNLRLLDEKRQLILRVRELEEACCKLEATTTQEKCKKNTLHEVSEVTSTTDINKHDDCPMTKLMIRCHRAETELLRRTTELIEAKEDNIRLRETMENLKALASCPSGRVTTAKEADKDGSRRSSNVSIDEIEALKHQIVVYQEDFHSEKSDKEKAEAEKRLLQGKLREAEDFIHALKQETVRYENALRSMCDEKDVLKRQIRRLSSTSTLPLSPVHGGFYHTNNTITHLPMEDDVIPRNDRKPTLVRMPSEVLFGGDVVRD